MHTIPGDPLQTCCVTLTSAVCEARAQAPSVRLLSLPTSLPTYVWPGYIRDVLILGKVSVLLLLQRTLTETFYGASQRSALGQPRIDKTLDPSFVCARHRLLLICSR